MAALLYLTEGAMGLPFFAKGGFGLLHLLGPTAGYLFMYPIQAYLIGALVEKKNIPFPIKFILSMAICSVQLFVGSLGLIPYVGLDKCFSIGLYPFVSIEALKAFLVLSYLKVRERKTA